jgi:hypothetical protein
MSANEAFSMELPEKVVNGRRLGRHVLHDPRSRQFNAPQAPQIESVTHAATALPLNQGNIGSCTANALCGALNSAPDFAGGAPLTEEKAVQLYERETQLEGKPYPPNDPGGTGLTVCKAAQQMRLITSYQHAFGIEHALQALVLRPVITGISWYTSFDNPDAQGAVSIAPGATVRGGHEIVADGIDAENKLVWFWNSWGSNWGLGGRFYLGFDTWDQLLQERGDVTVPIT